MQYTKNLDNYMNVKDTESCYLDGRYFNKVFENYPGTITESLNITIRPPRSPRASSRGSSRDSNSSNSSNISNNTNGFHSYPRSSNGSPKHSPSSSPRISKQQQNIEDNSKFHISMKESKINTQYPGLLRVIITTPQSRHSNLLILDYVNEKVYRFEPLGRDSPYFEKINNIIEQYLSMFFDFDLEVIEIDLDLYLDEKNPKCYQRNEKSGFCTAYNILYAYCYLNNKEFDPIYIKKFSGLIEQTYGKLPADSAEPDMGWFGNNNPEAGKIAVGAIGGAAVGGLLLGSPAGLLGGALAGGLIGSAL